MNLSPNGPNGGFDRLNAIIAGITTLIAFIVYYNTVSRTISYWDCGEFLSCAHILGNPHPPGSPLMVLIGRVFDIMALVKDVAFRINLLSVFSSSLTVLFGYLTVVRLVTSWYEGKEHYQTGRIIAYASGVIGALFMAFGKTNWGNSVEAEVYSLSMAIMLALFWLGLRWFDSRYSAAGQRIMILVSFLAMMSVGLHLTVFLIVPFVSIFFCLNDKATKNDWGLVAGFVIFEHLLVMMMAGEYARYKIFLVITLILMIGIVYYLRHKIFWPVMVAYLSLLGIMSDFRSYMYGAILGFAVTIIVWAIRRDHVWRLASLIILAGALGWTTNLYSPIRSTQHPFIDENTPSRSFSTFADFLDRKQYGNMDMTERMFVRRGTWANQFGDHARMGMWGFFQEQFSSEGFFPVLLLTGLFGLVWLILKTPSFGFVLLSLVIASTAGLVIYMNFADGTRYDSRTGDAYQEVRDRDYFWTPGFVLFGLVIGVGAGAVIEQVRKATEKLGAEKNRLAVLASCALVLTPIIPASANYFETDRSKNFMAYDYAYNLLSSCEKDALLFTSGDNDTFPLWAIQQCYDFRKDVRVINFSLLNTDWYVWQLKHFANVPISLEDDQILWENYALPNGEIIPKPAKPFNDRSRNRKAWLIPMPMDGKLVKVASMMLDDIILTNAWKFPIYFSSASGEVRGSPLKLMDRMYREGIALHLSRDMTGLAYKRPQSDSLFFDVYKYRGYADTLISEDENEAGISLTYPEKMLDFIDFVQKSGDSSGADALLERCCRLIPSYWRLRLTERDLFRRKGDTVRAMEIEQEMYRYLHGFCNMNPGTIIFYEYLGSTYYSLGDDQNAEKYLREAWNMNHDNEHTFRALLTLYAQQRRAQEMIQLATEYKDYHDDDPVANDVLRSAASLMQSPQQQAPPPATATPPESGGK